MASFNLDHSCQSSAVGESQIFAVKGVLYDILICSDWQMICTGQEAVLEIWLDSIDLETLKVVSRRALVDGVTTNPAIFSTAAHHEGLLGELLSLQKGPVAIQVTATEAHEMIAQGMFLRGISDRIVVKVPVTREGLAAIYQLSQEGISVLATAILDPIQALLAAKAGACMVAPYLSHMEKGGGEGLRNLQSMRAMYEHLKRAPKILVASVKEPDQILTLAQMGIDAVTLKADLMLRLLEDNMQSNAFTDKFNQQWQRRFFDRTFEEVMVQSAGQSSIHG